MRQSVISGDEPDKAEPVSSGVSVRFALVVSTLSLLLPWPIRRWLLNTLCNYSIARDARIGLSILGCTSLQMGASSRIGHFNVVKGIRVTLGESALIGELNWISGLPAGHSRHFREETERLPALTVDRHAALTSRHYIDCSNLVHIGEFTTVAGTRSQILTHAIDFRRNRQLSAPVRIGRYCFVGTGCVILKGSLLPDYSVLAASSCLSRGFEETFGLYSGVPATHVRALDRDALYFHRQQGFVD
jgi:carbonic anhydrase/acetyltransferase-like protein (isoleucine patch superfamily)